jgi:hypothetical protein
LLGVSNAKWMVSRLSRLGPKANLVPRQKGRRVVELGRDEALDLDQAIQRGQG